jgi:hypothetical protein
MTAEASAPIQTIKMKTGGMGSIESGRKQYASTVPITTTAVMPTRFLRGCASAILRVFHWFEELKRLLPQRLKLD